MHVATYPLSDAIMEKAEVKMGGRKTGDERRKFMLSKQLLSFVG
jgi:hypothetical protein